MPHKETAIRATLGSVTESIFGQEPALADTTPYILDSATSWVVLHLGWCYTLGSATLLLVLPHMLTLHL
jgi:hypothetical protein